MVFLIACGLICYTAAVRQKQELLLYQSRVTLFQRDRQFYTYEDAKQMRQRNEEAEEPLSYAIWGTEGMHVLENPVLRRSSMVEIYAVEGNSQLLFPSAVMLNPALTGGCLLGGKRRHRNCSVYRMLPVLRLPWMDTVIRCWACWSRRRREQCFWRKICIQRGWNG